MGKGKLLKLSPSRGPLRIVTSRDTMAFITSNKRHCFTKVTMRKGRRDGERSPLPKGGNFMYLMMNRFILYYQASERM